MNTVLKYDRIILVNELNEKMKKIGEVFEVANVLEDCFVLRDSKTRVAIGVISFEDFEKYFVKEENFKGWTSWTPINGADGSVDGCYRTNRKRVQVCFLKDKVRAESSCHNEDDFNLFFGIQLAYLRCKNKQMLKQKQKLEEELKNINIEITDNKRIMDNMINSLDG